MTISEEKKCVTIFVISDSAGETASKLAAASMAQYPTVDFTLIRRTFVKDEDKLVQALEDAKKAEAMVLSLMIISWRLLINFSMSINCSILTF